MKQALRHVFFRRPIGRFAPLAPAAADTLGRVAKLATADTLATAAALAWGLACLGASVLFAGVQVDRSFSKNPTQPSAPAFTVLPSMGRQTGGNLFHSFAQFNVAADQTVTFTGPGNVQRVIARVTGGEHSRIDGPVTVAIPRASFYLVNPAGVTLGPGGSVLADGVIVITCADSITLGQGKAAIKFAAAGQETPLLSAAAPAAFGFLGRRAPGKITLEGSRLTGSLGLGQVLSLVGGDVALTGGAAPFVRAGRVNVIAAGALNGEVRFNPESPRGRIDVSGMGDRGDVVLAAGNAADASPSSIASRIGGGVAVVARDLVLSGQSSIDVNTVARAGGSLDIDLTGALEISAGSRLAAKSTGVGDAGRIRVRAHSILIADPAFDAGVPVGAINANAEGSLQTGSGNAGQITLRAGTILISRGGNVSVNNNGSGKGGAITLIASRAIIIDGQGGGEGAPTGIIADAQDGSTGPSADIFISTPRLTMFHEADVRSTAKSAGNGGRIEVVAAEMLLDGNGQTRVPTQIDSRAGPFATGNGGEVVIHAGQLRLRDGGVISTTTAGRGHAGSVRVEAMAIQATGSERAKFTGVFSASRREQEAGRNSPRTGMGDAGSVIVSAAESLSLSSHAQISVFAQRSSAGDLVVDAGRALTMRSAMIDARARISSGRVTLVADQSVSLFRSRITAQTPGDGNAGKILIDPRVVSLNQSVIDGRAGAALNDVPVTIEASALLVSRDSAILTSKARFPVETDVARRVITLDAGLQQVQTRLLELCPMRLLDENQSSFVVTGRGGLPVEPGGLMPSLQWREE